jgi:hypothetical protein
MNTCCDRGQFMESRYLLGYNSVWSIKSKLTFRRNRPPPTSGPRKKPSKIPAWKQVANIVRHISRPWSWRRYDFPKRRLISNRLHGVIFRLCLPPAVKLVSSLTCSSALNMEAIYFFEMSVDFERTTGHYRGAGSGVVGWGTMLQAGRPPVRFRTRSFDFSTDLILPAAHWPWVRLSL